MFRLGTRYGKGNGVPKDAKLREHWYERAAKHGHIRGLCNLAMVTFDSHPTRHVADLIEAAWRGDAWACVLLGNAYAEGGRGLAVDKARAKRWFTKALTCKEQPPDDADREEANAWLNANTDVEASWKC